MTGPRFAADELVHKERRRDYNLASMSSRVRALELKTTSKHIAAEKSQTQCLFRRRRDELLCAMKQRVLQLERQAHNQQLAAAETAEMPASSRHQFQAGSPPVTDPYPVSFGRAHQKSREDELLVQYHGRRRKSYEFEDAAPLLRGRVAAQPLHPSPPSFRRRRLSKELEDLPRQPSPAVLTARPPPAPPSRERPLRLTQRRKSGEFEDIHFSQRLSPLLQRRRKSKEFEDVVVLFRRPPTRRAFAPMPDERASTASDHAPAPSGEQLRRQQLSHLQPPPPPPQPLLRRMPTPMPSTSPKPPSGAGQRHRVRMTYPVDKIATGPAEFTSVYEVSGDTTPDNADALPAGNTPSAPELRASRSFTYVLGSGKAPEKAQEAEEQKTRVIAADAAAAAATAAAAVTATAIAAVVSAAAVAPTDSALSVAAVKTVVV